MYDIRDVVKKAIDIANQKKALYEKLSENVWDPGTQLAIKVLKGAVESDISHYKSMIDNISDEMAETIDFGIYDKVSSLVNQFSRLILMPDLQTKTSLIEFAIDLEERSYALMIDIQGRMVTETKMSETVSYYVLTELIEEKRLFVEKLRAFL